jgi:hypothetical protein
LQSSERPGSEPVERAVALAQQLADRNPTNTEYQDRFTWIRNVLLLEFHVSR